MASRISADSFPLRKLIPRAFSAGARAEPPAKRPRGEKVVSVNVGGRVFTTSDTTLRKSPFFVDLFDNIHNKKRITRDEMGNPFVDRDADAFDEVLKFMRTGVLPAVKYKARLLDNELDFFDITYLLPVPEGHESDACESGDDESEGDDDECTDKNAHGNLKGFAVDGCIPGKLWRRDLDRWCEAARSGMSGQKKGKPKPKAKAKATTKAKK
jgi:hypothetical protein